MAALYECQVHGIDLSDKRCREADSLTNLVGLSHLVSFECDDFLTMEVPAGLYDILWGQGAWLQVPDKRDFVQRWSGCLAEGRSNRLRTRLSRATGERGARGEAGAGEGAGGARVLLAGPAHKPTGLARPIRSRWLDRRAPGRSHSDIRRVLHQARRTCPVHTRGPRTVSRKRRLAKGARLCRLWHHLLPAPGRRKISLTAGRLRPAEELVEGVPRLPAQQPLRLVDAVLAVGGAGADEKRLVRVRHRRSSQPVQE